MLLFGLSDLPAADVVEACPECGGAAHIDGGACVSCLLRRGLNSPSVTPSPPPVPPSPSSVIPSEVEGSLDITETLTNESWYDLLAQINIRDADWRLGNYQILDEIGRGGMGVIYRARQRHSRRIVALKRVLSYHSESRETLERFRREAEAAASLDHPNILPIYEVGEADDLPFFTMKFATGGSLQLAAPMLRQDTRECVRLVMKITRAVAYAHGEGILHRDLKPGNILLDARGEPLVSDFGLAKWLDGMSDLTRTLTIFGNPGYIAPEQAHSAANELTPAADIYSLGAILFDLLTGRPPFLGEHALAVIKQADEKPAPKLRSLIKNADRDLETICAKCLEREPSARYRSAADLAEDLQRWLEGRPIIARNVSPPVKLWRWTKRNPILAASIAACLGLGAATILFEIQAQLKERATAVALHFIGVGPFLDLDSVQYDANDSNALAVALQRELSNYGPARVIPVPGTAATTGSEASAAAWNGVRAGFQATKRIHNGKFRVSLRLINTANGKVFFKRIVEGGTSEHNLDAAAKSVANEIYSLLNHKDLSSVEIAESDPGWRDTATRELLIAGRKVMEHRTITDMEQAARLFQKAIESKPQSALAHSNLANAEYGLRFFTGEPKHLVTALAAAKRAIDLNPTAVDPHRAMSRVLFEQCRFREALDEAFNAYELADSIDAGQLNTEVAANIRQLGDPVRAIAWYRMGRSDRPAVDEFMVADCLADLTADDLAEAAYRRVWTLLPDHPEGWLGLCRLALLRRDFASARKIASENRPRYKNFVFSEQMSAQVEFFSRNFVEAEKIYQELVAKDPNGGADFYGAVSYRSALGRLRIAANDRPAGEKLLQEALNLELDGLHSASENSGGLYLLAAIESSLGNLEPALKHLREALNSGWIDYRSAELDPRFDAVRALPAFRETISTAANRVAKMQVAMRSQQQNDTTKSEVIYGK